MNILFMCVANSARSQLAEGLARKAFPNAKIESAGSNPGTLNPFAVHAMREIGIDISKHVSKSYDDLPKNFIANLDYVITLCDEEVCPVIISKAKKLHWPLPDPASKEPMPDEALLQRFRIARDSIEKKLTEFKDQL
ncbi:MAG: low molecular weight phosphatase family protein [Bdellovibrio sp. 28-41-41]|nr:MAG: low molecular weight phosphatase family protein [Bdellovibrio sp. 28-41-41]